MSKIYACILIKGSLFLLSLPSAKGTTGQRDTASERYARRANAAEATAGSGANRGRGRATRVRHARTSAIAGQSRQNIFASQTAGRRQAERMNRYREPNPFHERNHENPLAQRVRDN